MNNTAQIQDDRISVEEQNSLATLIAAVAAGDQKAFKKLYDRTSGRAFGLATRMLGSAASAQDVLQEAYMKIWANADRYSVSKGNALPWLLSVVRYRALDKIRSEQRRPINSSEEFREDFHEQTISAARKQGFSGGDEDLALCLEALGSKQREGIVQTFVYGWTYEEFAARVATPIGTVKSRIRRGLQKLKECLEQ